MKPIAAAIATAVGAVPAVVTAQDAGADQQRGMLEEIVVTATRRAESVQDIPINISAFAGNELERQRIDNLREFARYVPGLTVVDQGPRNGSPMIVRGLNVDHLQVSDGQNGSGNTVATYFGEIPIYIDLDLVDMDRVEVLRGPQGTLFGASTLAGAVRFIPNKPDPEAFDLEVHGRTYSIAEADDLSYVADIMVNVPIADNWAFRGVAKYMDQAGWIDQPFIIPNADVGLVNPEDPASFAPKEDANDWRRTTFRASLLWDVTENGSAQLNYNYQKDEVGARQLSHRDQCEAVQSGTSGRTDFTTPPAAGPYPAPAFPAGCSVSDFEYVNTYRVAEPSDRENQIVNLDVIWDFGFAEFTSATGYTQYDQTAQRDQTDLLLNFEVSYGEFPEFGAFTAEVEDTTTMTQEFRLVSQGDSRLNWIAGFFYLDQDFFQTSTEFTPGGLVGDPATSFFGITGVVDAAGNPNFIEYFQIIEENLEEWAVYGEVGYDFTDRWDVTVGMRHFDVEDTFTQGFAFPICDIFGFCQFTTPQPDAQQLAAYIPSDQPTTSVQKIDDEIFKFNTSFAFTETMLGYFTWSEGYRNGGSNSIALCVPPISANAACGAADELAFTPDTTSNWELGLKTSWLDDTLVINGALFFVEWDDVQLGETSQSGAIPITINGNSAETQGIELDGQWQIGEHWRLGAGYSYTEAELSADAPQLAGGAASNGDRLPGTPEHQGALVVDYLTTFRNGMDFTVSYAMTSQSDVFTKLGNGSTCCRISNGTFAGQGEILPGFTVHNLSFGIARDQWELMLYANNLSNKYAESGVREDPSFLVTSIESAAPTYRRHAKYAITPRQIGLDFRWRTQ